jgi:cysteine sulfinate desulfinase/cysteine desulfurase-like protein
LQEQYGNASSLYSLGTEAKRDIEQSALNRMKSRRHLNYRTGINR